MKVYGIPDTMLRKNHRSNHPRGPNRQTPYLPGYAPRTSIWSCMARCFISWAWALNSSEAALVSSEVAATLWAEVVEWLLA